MKAIRTLLGRLSIACLAWGGLLPAGSAADLPEYQLKAAFLYNFALFTEWPAETGPTITLCVLEGNAFRNELDEFQGQSVGARRFAVRRVQNADGTQECQMVFLPKSPPEGLGRVLKALGGRRHLLLIGDSSETAKAGVGINLTISNARVAFDVNLHSVQDAGLNLSSKLLRLAQNVR